MVVYPNSETFKCRERLKKYCVGDGLDIGFAGDPIVPTAITIDLPVGPYGRSVKTENGARILGMFGDHPQNIHGDGTNLYWFNDRVFDYVYASHLLEDFTVERIPLIIEEWMRVLKIGGYLVINCPDEQTYREFYRKKGGKLQNFSHKNEKFGLNFLLDLLGKVKTSYEVVHTLELDDSYCFDLVLKKN
jgi:SAM-dependent methyltransferase